MIDTDIIAHLDSQTGLPAVDLRSPAQRWFEALDEGPESNPKATNTTFATKSNFRGGRRRENQRKQLSGTGLRISTSHI
jgi:hypothetical protein